MTPESDKRLRVAFPLLFQGPLLNDEPIRCGEGWYHLLWMLCAGLEAAIQTEVDVGDCERAKPYRAVQVKEKFSTLRFYLDGAPTDAMTALIDAAEIASAHICDVCGKRGTLIPGNPGEAGGWVRVRCKEHIDTRPRP